MSDFAIKASQRQRLLAGDYKPLVFKGVLDPDGREPLPHGCCVGARYVLAWKQSTAVTDEDDGFVTRTPKHPVWYLTVTKVEGGPRKPRQLVDRPWVVRFDVVDIRVGDLFLKPGGGDLTSSDPLNAGAKPNREWMAIRAKTVGEFWHQRRLARHAEELRERSRARRKRAA